MRKIGIIGFGVVGKSALSFIIKQCPNVQVQVWDERILNSEEYTIVEQACAQFCPASAVPLKNFINDNDELVVSPGVNLSAYEDFGYKFVCELDLFAHYFKKPSIAVTGTLGKTTVTKLIGALANDVPSYGTTLVGGNIGFGMLDLIVRQDACDCGVLELSSFQLERSRKFVPDIAVWTNFYPNHLDRHQTIEGYFNAKAALIRSQNNHQHAILCYELWQAGCNTLMDNLLNEVKSIVSVYTEKSLESIDLMNVNRSDFLLFYMQESWLCKATIVNKNIQSTERLVDMTGLPDYTFIQNWVAVLVALYHRGTSFSDVVVAIKNNAEKLLDDHHHRMELCATINGVDFYDDSKSTVIQATIAAFHKLTQKQRPILLILGGLGKGAVRGPALDEIRQHPLLKKVYCFGNECTQFTGCLAFQTLDQVLLAVAKAALPGDIVLFSPSGTSFDFFKNYSHRGMVFQEMVKKLHS